MKTTNISCVQDPYRSPHTKYKINDINRIKLIETVGWLLILITLLILIPPVKGDTMTPSDTISPSGVNWTYNWSFTVTFDNLIENSTHINFTGISNWDQSQLIVGENGDLYTHSDSNHNTTMTNLSNSYTKIDLDLNGNTSINISDMNTSTSFDIYHDGVLNKTVTSDSNGYLFFYEEFTGWKTIEINESTVTTTYNVSGYILNTTGSGISGATVSNNVTSQENTSTSTGYYELTGLSNDTYKITASKTGYQDNSTIVTVSGSDLTNQNITLTPIPPTNPVIYDYSPSTPVTIEKTNSQTFSADVNQSTNNLWEPNWASNTWDNGTDSPSETYTFNNIGEYNLTLVAYNTSNSSYSDSQTWNITVEDTTPPSQVTGLGETAKSQSSINWSWTNPGDSDFNHSMIYVDGVFKGNVSNTTTYYKATGFSCEETHTISVKTVDFYDNVGSAEEDSATTDLCPGGGGGGGVGGANLAPTADFSYNKITQYKVSFTDESSDSDGVLVDWLWDFGDGDTSTAQDPTHTYSFGTYTITLTITDDDGATDSYSEEITIQKVIIKPTATTTVPSAPDYYENLTDVLGSGNITNGTATNPNMSTSFQGFAKTMALPYVGLMGALFFAYAFFLPYMMMWLRQENAMIATVIGIVLGVTVMLAFAPAQFRLIVMAIIALILTGRIYLWMRGRA